MDRTASLLLVTALAACGGGHPTPDKTPAPTAVVPTVEIHAAVESDVNSYVLSDGQGTVIIDATRTSADGRAVAALARAHGDGPVTLLITHGHPDHFLGLGALRAEIPRLRVVVARPEIEADIIGMATWMTAQGWLEQEPAMKPRSDANPGGFDYAGVIEVLDQPTLTLPGGATLELTSDYDATEAAHETTVYAPALNALFTGDLGYNGVHLWLGVGVTRDAAAAWQHTLDNLATTWAPRKPTVYPGHGQPGDTAIFAADRQYISDLLQVVDHATSDQDAIEQMAARYPTFRNQDFLLMMSVTNQRTQRTAAAN